MRLEIDLTGLEDMTSTINALLAKLPEAKQNLLSRLANRLQSKILDTYISEDIRYTGTYGQSIKVVQLQSGNEPIMALSMIPSGSQASRLPIYWKTLEFGSSPNPMVPTAPLVEWASTKFFNPAVGLLVASKIRTRGVSPHPVLQSVLNMAPPAQILGFNSLGIQFADEAAIGLLNEMQVTFTTFVRRGVQVIQPRIPAGLPGGGRFRALPRI